MSTWWPAAYSLPPTHTRAHTAPPNQPSQSANHLHANTAVPSPSHVTAHSDRICCAARTYRVWCCLTTRNWTSARRRCPDRAPKVVKAAAARRRVRVAVASAGRAADDVDSFPRPRPRRPRPRRTVRRRRHRRVPLTTYSRRPHRRWAPGWTGRPTWTATNNRTNRPRLRRPRRRRTSWRTPRRPRPWPRRVTTISTCAPPASSRSVSAGVAQSALYTSRLGGTRTGKAASSSSRKLAAAVAVRYARPPPLRPPSRRCVYRVVADGTRPTTCPAPTTPTLPPPPPPPPFLMRSWSRRRQWRRTPQPTRLLLVRRGTKTRDIGPTAAAAAAGTYTRHRENTHFLLYRRRHRLRTYTWEIGKCALRTVIHTHTRTSTNTHAVRL